VDIVPTAETTGIEVICPDRVNDGHRRVGFGRGEGGSWS
jgi:hypothetical protein